MNKLQSFKSALTSIPAVHEIQNLPEIQKLISDYGHSLVTNAIRSVQFEFRNLITSSGDSNLEKINKNVFLKQLKHKISILSTESLVVY